MSTNYGAYVNKVVKKKNFFLKILFLIKKTTK